MSRRNLPSLALCLVVIVVGARRAGAVYYVESQTFDTSSSASSAGWATQDNLLNSNNYGFSNTSNAGGPAGEAGGTFARSSGENHYADTTIGGTYSLATSNLFGYGKYHVGPIPNSAIGGIEVGFRSLDGSAGTNHSFAGMIVFDNNNNTSSRVFAAVELTDGTLILGNTITVPLGTYDFSFLYSPVGTMTLVVPQGTSTLTLTSGQLATGATFDGFGLGGLSLNNVPSQAGNLFIDNVTYGVPEPASLGLAVFGAALCKRRRRH